LSEGINLQGIRCHDDYAYAVPQFEKIKRILRRMLRNT
jgi:hypothetical protein